jgi:hypothetical protein
METKLIPSVTHPAGEPEILSEALRAQAALAVETFGGRVHVEWNPQAAVTPLGQLPFFIEFLKTAELFKPWVEECPLERRSPNAPANVDLLGTLLPFSVPVYFSYPLNSPLNRKSIFPRSRIPDTIRKAKIANRLGAAVSALAKRLRQRQVFHFFPGLGL